jgi:hypothetical protein
MHSLLASLLLACAPAPAGGEPEKIESQIDALIAFSPVVEGSSRSQLNLKTDILKIKLALQAIKTLPPEQTLPFIKEANVAAYEDAEMD